MNVHVVTFLVYRPYSPCFEFGMLSLKGTRPVLVRGFRGVICRIIGSLIGDTEAKDDMYLICTNCLKLDNRSRIVTNAFSSATVRYCWF
jgi:hypothetical protein